MFSCIHSHIPDVAAVYPERERLGQRIDTHDLQQHTTHRLRIAAGIPHFAADRRMALPQMVGLVQEAFQGREEGLVDKEQRIDDDFPAPEHFPLYGLRLLWYIRDTDPGIHILEQLRDLLHNLPAGYPCGILVQEDT